VLVAVSLDDDPGRQLDSPRRPGRRYYFRVDEVAIENSPTSASRPRVLVAGIGNIFLGDDAFGVEVVRRLASRAVPPAVRVADFGIRGVDLTFALLEGFETAILVDAASRGGLPGALYVLELSGDDDKADADRQRSLGDIAAGHTMTPDHVLRWA